MVRAAGASAADSRDRPSTVEPVRSVSACAWTIGEASILLRAVALSGPSATTAGRPGIVAHEIDTAAASAPVRAVSAPVLAVSAPVRAVAADDADPAAADAEPDADEA